MSHVTEVEPSVRKLVYQRGDVRLEAVEQTAFGKTSSWDVLIGDQTLTLQMSKDSLVGVLDVVGDAIYGGRDTVEPVRELREEHRDREWLRTYPDGSQTHYRFRDGTWQYRMTDFRFGFRPGFDIVPEVEQAYFTEWVPETRERLSDADKDKSWRRADGMALRYDNGRWMWRGWEGTPWLGAQLLAYNYRGPFKEFYE